MSKISDADLEALIAQFERSDWKTLEFSSGGLELFLSKDAASARGRPAQSPPPAQPTTSLGSPTTEQPPEPAVGPTKHYPAHWQTVRATSLGTFYRAQKPGSPPLTEVGANVSEDSELCLIEVMKLFTTLRAGVSGIVRDVLAKDGELVEYGQPLFVIEPHG